MEDMKVAIQEWVQLDETLTAKRQDIKRLTVQKKNVSEKLLSLMRANNIDDFTLKGGSLRRKHITTKSPLNKQMLMTVLSKYYETEADSVQKASEMTMLLLSSRTVKTTEVLSRKI
jgi:hypothetical protein